MNHVKIGVMAIIGLWPLSVQGQNTQATRDHRTEWGIHLAGAATIVGFQNKSFSRYALPGFQAGLYASRPISSSYEVTLAFHLARYGSTSYSTWRFTSATFDTTFYLKDIDTYTYLNIAPQLRYYPIQAGSVKPFIGCGLFGGYLVRGRNHRYTQDGTFIGSANQGKAFHRWNHGVLLEIGAKISTTRLKAPLRASISYETGLVDIAHYPPGYSIQHPLFKTNAYSLHLFYTLSQ